MKTTILSIVLMAATVPVFAAQELGEQLIGDWCLNTEEYDGEITVDGSKWTFKEDGNYVYKQAYESIEPYSIEGDTIILKGFGKMKVISISDSEIVGKVYSTYHFTRNRCLPIVEEAFKLTELNNSIIEKNLDKVKEIVSSGIDINKPDTRSSQRSTPIMVAAKFGTIETIKYLLSLKPDLSKTNASGRTALEIAERSGNAEVIELIKPAL